MRVTATPHNVASEMALAIYAKVLDGVRSDALVHQAMQRVGDALFIQGRHIDLSHYDRVWIAGSGKASTDMARAASEVLGDRLSGGVIVTKAGSGSPITGIEVIEASHPVPDVSSLFAGSRLLEFAAELNEKDLVLFLLSGGSSALIESPRDTISLDDLQKTNQVLLSSNVDITAMNAVRSRLSRIKAGGLARAFEPATVIALILSDVVGNDLQTIGSGPLISPKANTTPMPEWLFPFLPTSVQALLEVSLPPKPLTVPVEHYVVGGISLAILAAVKAAMELDLKPFPYADPLKGEARTMSAKICTLMKKWPLDNGCLIFGGETTVKIKGKGLGGRCQEMAVAAARTVSEMPDVCFLACGTDGSDGPTDATGGIVDPGSIARAKQAGFHRSRSLADNDSYHFLEASGGLVLTGPTGSNVNDLVLVVHATD